MFGTRRFFTKTVTVSLGVASALALVAGASASGAAGSTSAAAATLFGPVNVMRQNGPPQTIRWTVSAASPGAGYLVCVDNAGVTNQFRAATSATVKLNGLAVMRPNDFKRWVTTVSIPVVMNATNELSAEIAGEPGAGFTLWIEQDATCSGGGGPGPTNSAPVFTSTPIVTGQRLVSYAYAAAASDADSDSLTFSLQTSPQGMAIDPQSGAISWLPIDTGAFDVIVRVEDGRGGIASQPYVVNVTIPGNRPPDLLPVADRRVPRGAAVEIALGANDPDPFDTLTFGLTGGPAGASVTPGPIFKWMPGPGQLGSHTIIVNVHDGAGASDSAAFTIEVVDTNGAPIIDPQPNGVTAGAPFLRTLTALDPNPGDALTFSLVSGPSGLTVAPGGAVSWTPTNAQAGTHHVMVKVTDSGGLSDAASFSIDVNVAALVQPPTASDDRYATRRGHSLNIPASGVLANDVDPAGLSLTGQVVTQPTRGALSFAADGGFLYTPAVPAPGSTMPAVKFTYMAIPSNNTPGSSRGQPVVADLNRDGIPEILVMSTAQFTVRRLIAVRGDTGTTAWMIDAYQPLATPQIVVAMGGAGNQGSFSVGDLDGDGFLEILVVHSDDETSKLRRRLIAFNHDGTYRWTSDDIVDLVNVVSTTGMFQIQQADLDGDGVPEIIAHHTGKSPQTPSGVVGEDLVTVFNSDGHIRWTKRVPGLASADALAIADIDLDGQPEIVIGNAALDPAGNIEWNTKSTNAGIVDIAIGNFDGDPFAELIFLDRFGQVYCYEHTGAMKWGPVRRTGGFSFGQLAIGDTDGDGLPEIVLPRAVSTGAVEVWDGNGNLVRTMSLPGSFNTQAQGGTPTIFDLNGDGRPEVIYHSVVGSFDTLTSHGSLFMFDGPTGALLHELHASRSSATSAGPIVADVDGDGSAEIVASGWNDGVLSHVFTAAAGKWAETRPIWNQDGYHITNIEKNGRVPAHEAINWLTPGLNNYRVNVPLPKERTEDKDQFTYVASNGALSSNIATVHLDLLPPNTAPRILSSAPPAAAPGIQYLYAVRAVDPDLGETLGFTLVSGPAGMTIEPATGLVKWTPPAGASGPMMAIVKVVDTQGQSDSQEFTIVVGPAVIVPSVMGQTLAGAQSTLGGAGLFIGTQALSSSTVQSGLILSQDPGPGTLVASAGLVNLVVSSGPAPAAVPLLVGRPEATAQMLATSAGFAVNVTRVFSNDVPDGLVVSQHPAAGSMLVPGLVSVTVSAGSGITLRLARHTTTADQALPFTVTAHDLAYVESAAPALNFSVTPTLLPSFGSVPSVSGNAILPSAGTRGKFRVTALDPQTGRSASAEFSVTFPREAGVRSLSDVYEDLSAAISDIDTLIRQARVARLANDVTAMRSLLDQMVQRWRQVDVGEVRLATPFGLELGFFPAPKDLAALGLTPTADDLAAQHVLKEASADLQAWIDGLREPSTSMPALRQLADRFNTGVARMNDLTLSEWGVIKGQSYITAILSTRIPDFYDALMNDLAKVVLNGQPDPETAASGPWIADSTLGEMATTIAVDFIVEKIMEWGWKQVGDAKQFTHDIMGQALWSAAVVAAAKHFKEFANGQSLDAVVAGASLSFHVFDSPWSFVEGEFDTDESINNVLITIGPNLWTAGADTFSGVKTAAGAARNATGIFRTVRAIYKFVKIAGQQFSNLEAEAQNAFQPGGEIVRGCVFSSAPACAQLMYVNGLKSVYTYSSPLQNMVGLPVPILFVTFNKTTGMIYVDTPVFLPTKK